MKLGEVVVSSVEVGELCRDRQELVDVGQRARVALTHAMELVAGDAGGWRLGVKWRR